MTAGLTDRDGPDPAALGLPPTTGTLAELIAAGGSRAAVLVGSRDPNAKLTLVLPAAGRSPAARLAVKVPTTTAAAGVVLAEGALLAAVRRRLPDDLAATLPRPVRYVDADGLPALVTTGLAGVPMLVGYHRWRHTARPARVAADFAAAGAWLARLQDATAGAAEPAAGPEAVVGRIAARFGVSVRIEVSRRARRVTRPGATRMIS